MAQLSRFNQIPTNYNLKVAYGGVSLFLEIDKKDQTNAIGYQYILSDKSLESELDEFCEWSLQRKIDDLIFFESKISTNKDNVFHPVRLNALLAIEQWHGFSPPYNRIVGKDLRGLLCRCFGIYEDELLKHLRANPFDTDLDLTKEFKVGAACTSCLEDLSSFVAEFRKKLHLTTNEKRQRFGDLTPAQVILAAAVTIDHFVKDRKLPGLVIEELTGRNLWVEDRGAWSGEELEKERDELINELKAAHGLICFFSWQRPVFYNYLK